MNILGAKRLVNTTGMPREKWLRYRQFGLGGSDAGAILGVNPYRSPMEVFRDKLSEFPIETEDNEAMRQGRDLEEYVAKRFCEQEGKTVRRCNAILRHEKYPFLLANVDRIVDGENAILECKTAKSFLWGKYQKDDIPLPYIFQCYHYLMVCPQAERVYLAVLIYGMDFKVYTIERQQDQIDQLMKKEVDWWDDHIVMKRMPEPDGSESCQKMLNDMFGTSDGGEMELPGNCDLLLKELETSMEEFKALKTKCSQLKQKIELAMGNATVGTTKHFVVKWKPVAGRKTFDQERFLEKYPSMLDLYCKEGAQTRRFTFERTVE